MRKTRLELMRVCDDIRRLRSEEGKSPAQIIKQLNIPRSDYYYYQAKIWQQDKGYLERMQEQQLAHEVVILKDRLEDSYRNLVSIAKDSEESAKDRIEAESKRMEAAINVVKLLKEGPGAIGIGHNRGITEQATSKPEITN